MTENILGLNLPSCQVQVAMGIPLHRIGDVRKLYGRDPRGRDTIDFDYTPQQRPEVGCGLTHSHPHPYPPFVPSTQYRPGFFSSLTRTDIHFLFPGSPLFPPQRHCIAVRVTAENPEQGFQPTSGRIYDLQFRSSVDVWGYFSVNNSGRIHEFADSQFGHIFASGKDRESARRAMVNALKELEIRGDIRTTIEYIVKLLQSKDFACNNIDTTWLDSRIANHTALELEER